MTVEECILDELRFLKNLASHYEKNKMEGIAYILRQRIYEVEIKLKSVKTSEPIL